MQCKHAINTLFIVIICKKSIRGNSSIIIRPKKIIKKTKQNKNKRKKKEIQQIKPLKNTK
jgi:hypothetical protein